jgi:ABC-type methionine transport system permease subunit
LTVLGGATVETADRHLGHVVAIVLSIRLLGARNTSPHIVVFHLTRLRSTPRAINELVFALIFVSAVGLGPFAGVLAVALHATGMLAKFCAEEIEGVDKGQVEAQMATGGSRIPESCSASPRRSCPSSSAMRSTASTSASARQPCSAWSARAGSDSR